MAFSANSTIINMNASIKMMVWRVVTWSWILVSKWLSSISLRTTDHNLIRQLLIIGDKPALDLLIVIETHLSGKTDHRSRNTFKLILAVLKFTILFDEDWISEKIKKWRKAGSWRRCMQLRHRHVVFYVLNLFALFF